MSESLRRHIALQVAERFIGTPYRWAGSDPMGGFDCSGLMVECLKSCGVLPPAGDWTADALMHRFVAVNSPLVGDLVFWVWNGEALHVEMVYEPTLGLSLGASGGGSTTKTLAAAEEQDAFVKIRTYLNRRKEPFVFRNPYLIGGF